jgi:toxin ParE1/3/4
MASNKLVLWPRAENDLDDIWFLIAASSTVAADRFVDGIKDRFAQLVKFPESGVSRPEILPNARILIEGKYVVIYSFNGTNVEILRVVHGARDLTELDFS